MGDYLADGTSKNPHADVLLVNARLITPTPFAENRYYDKAGMSRGAPAVEADKEGAPEFVAVTSGKIVGVGPAREARRFKCPRTREIDCQGMTLGARLHRRPLSHLGIGHPACGVSTAGRRTPPP